MTATCKIATVSTTRRAPCSARGPGDYFEACSPPALGVPVPALEEAGAAFARAVAAGYGGDDFSRAIALRLAAAGVPAP